MKPFAFKLAVSILLLCGLTSTLRAQVDSINVVTSAVPFLRISPDARSGGMGELGIATSPDVSAGMWNMGKVVFNKSTGGIGATYTPWLKDLVNDVYLLSFSGYYKFDSIQALSGAIRYFSLGNIEFTDALGNSLTTEKPREFGIEVGYSRMLGTKNGLGIALRYINSNLAEGISQGGQTYKTGSSVAADIGWYYDGKNTAGQGWVFGATLTNLGAKISYTDNEDAKDYIPANLGFGTNYTRVFNNQNQISFGLEINKLLVPTPPSNPTQAELDEYRNKGVVGSWFSSFGDAPDGFGEEMKEFQISIGGEYWYNNQFAFRLGYFHEGKTKGDRSYFTTGIGIKYNIFGFNFAYLLPSGNGVERNPLSNTLRFSILFDLGKGSKVEEKPADK